MSRRSKVLSAVAVVAAAVGTYHYLDKNGRKSIKKDIADCAQPASVRTLRTEKKENGTVCVEMPGEELRLLYLTDLHLTAGHFTQEKDRAMLRDVSAIVRAARPDIVVLGGDFISPIFVSSFTRDSKTQAAAVGTLMKRLGVAWSFLPGNHEHDGHAPLREVVKELYRFAPLHSMAPGAEGVNTCLLLQKEGRPVHSVFLMDTHNLSKGHWDGVRPGQIDWFLRTARENVAPGTVLCHIPLTSYADSFSSAKEGAGEKLFGKGRKGTKAADFGFDSALPIGGCRLVLCGHNHFQNWLVRGEDDIVRGYNLSMDHSVYPHSHLRRSHLGGTLLRIREDGGILLERYRPKSGERVAYFVPRNERVEISAVEKNAKFVGSSEKALEEYAKFS